MARAGARSIPSVTSWLRVLRSDMPRRIRLTQRPPPTKGAPSRGGLSSPAMTGSGDPVRVGLFGAGPWARTVTGPIFAAGPETELVGVWSRTPAHAKEAAAGLGVEAYDTAGALIEASGTVAVAVAPHAQPGLAALAVEAGRPVLLPRSPSPTTCRTRAGSSTRSNGHAPVRCSSSRTGSTLRSSGSRERSAISTFSADADASSRARSSRPARTHTGGAWNAALLDVGPHLLDLHEVGRRDRRRRRGGRCARLGVAHAPPRRVTGVDVAVVPDRDGEPHRDRGLRFRRSCPLRRTRRRSSGDRSEHPGVVRRGRTRRLAPRRRPPRPAPANAHRAGGATAPDVVQPLRAATTDGRRSTRHRCTCATSTGDVGFHTITRSMISSHATSSRRSGS